MIKRKHWCIFHSRLHQCINIYAYKKMLCVFFSLTRILVLWWSTVLKLDFGTTNSFNCNHPIVQKLVKKFIISGHLMLSNFVWYSTFLMKWSFMHGWDFLRFFCMSWSSKMVNKSKMVLKDDGGEISNVDYR